MAYLDAFRCWYISLGIQTKCPNQRKTNANKKSYITGLKLGLKSHNAKKQQQKKQKTTKKKHRKKKKTAQQTLKSTIGKFCFTYLLYDFHFFAIVLSYLWWKCYIFKD